MYFRHHFWIEDILIEAEKEITFDYGSSHDIVCTIRQKNEVEHNRRPNDRSAVCVVTSEIEPKSQIRSMFESLLERKLPKGSQDPDAWLASSTRKSGQTDFMDSDGRLKENTPPPLEIMPQAFQSFIEQVNAELRNYAVQTVRVIRWRLNSGMKHTPLKESRGGAWSIDGDKWYDTPGGIYLTVEAYRLALPLSMIKDEIIELVRSGQTEPLGHELFREAWGQVNTNPRSALVMGIAAAEIGIKQSVALLLPQAQWLVENLPSPPIIQILTDYFPGLPVKCTINGDVMIRKTLIEKLKKGVQMRNNLVHGRSVRISPENVKDILRSVKELLYLLDYYCGYSWSLRYLPTESQEITEESRNHDASN